jgi:hypothetical protein
LTTKKIKEVYDKAHPRDEKPVSEHPVSKDHISSETGPSRMKKDNGEDNNGW